MRLFLVFQSYFELFELGLLVFMHIPHPFHLLCDFFGLKQLIEYVLEQDAVSKRP